MTTTSLTTELGRLLPPTVHCTEAFGPPPQGALLPAERAHISGRSARRQRQFTAARTLARRALAQLGHPPVPLLPGPGGAPEWPSGAVGSITHCDGYTACAAAHAADVISLGIDAEPALPLPGGVLALTASEDERHRLDRLPHGQVPWDRLLFSAKEATYKACYPLTRRWTGLAGISVRLHPDHTFTAHHPHLPGRCHGRWTSTDAVLLTALTIPHGTTTG
ncbi:4'-phosphopantetheinyl transferase [Kitasatospora sp. NBC_01300]|uniref:4'-phosphopantetheinyl transferase family protein n=1 Tax=Kitasatospora sp. NBC_01300 TaxID=2903574 RepID=UPI00352BFA44|nr:4'-phosphopantetheinyl transferase superfamily protein [Kitasatospora sp. NBC_01300]